MYLEDQGTSFRSNKLNKKRGLYQKKVPFGDQQKAKVWGAMGWVKGLFNFRPDKSGYTTYLGLGLGEFSAF